MAEASKKTLSESDVEGTLNKLRAADTDRKVDIVQFFGLQLEDVEELPESTVDPILLLLPPLIRTPHTLLLTSTLTSLIPFFIPLIPSSPPQQQHLRLALLQLLPALIERLNDAKDRIHGAAASGVYLLGRQVYQAEQAQAQSAALSNSGSSASAASNTLNHSVNGKGKEKETLAQSYDRQLRDALAGKAWRAKVEVMKVLIRLRAELGGKMGLKGWLAPLVELLEDGDGNVRDQAKETVVALLSPSSTPPAARSELKKLLLARNVRKTIADNIISRVLGGEAAQPSSGRTSGASTPYADKALGASDGSSKEPAGAAGSGAERSSASTPVPAGNDDVEIVYVASPRDLEHEFAAMLPHFQGKETEQNWAPREKSIVRIRGMLKGKAAEKYHEAFVIGLKGGIVEGLTKTIVSLRTTVAQQSCFLVRELPENLGSSFDPFVENLLPVLGKMAGYTKKIIAERSQACVTAIIVHTTVHPRILIGHIAAGVGEKNIQTRHFSAGHLKTFLDIHAFKSKSIIEGTAGLLDQIEAAVKKALGDVNPAVRELARAGFWSFHNVWSSRATAIMNSLDAQARKQLEKVNPHENDGTDLAPSASSSTTATAPSTAGAAVKPPVRRGPSAMSAMLAEKRRAKAAELAAGRIDSPRTVSNPVPGSPSIQQGLGSGLTRSNSNVSIAARAARPGLSARAATSPEKPQEDLPGAGAASPSPRQRTPQNQRTHSSSLVRTPPSSSRGSPTPRDSPLRQSSTIPHHSASPSPLRSPTSTTVTSTSTSAHLKTPTLNRKHLPTSSGSVGLGLQTPPTTGGTGRRELDEWPESGESASMTPTRGTGTSGPGAMVDDARKAQAAQAESAAQQLMEYDEVSSTQNLGIGPITPARHANDVYVHDNGDGEGKGNGNSLTPIHTHTDTANANAHRHGQGNGDLFQTPQPSGRRAWEDSPRPETVTPMMVEKLKERRHERSWWVKRQELLDKASPLRPSSSAASASASAIQPDLEALSSGQATLRNLQKLALFSSDHPVPQSSDGKDDDDGDGDDEGDNEREVWLKEKVFERILAGLFAFLSTAKTHTQLSDKGQEQLIEQALVVLWEMIQHQHPLFDGHEQDLVEVLFKLRAQTSVIILESTNALISLLTQISDPIYLLSLLRSSLLKFLEAHPGQPFPSPADPAGAEADLGRLSLSAAAAAGTGSDDKPRVSGYIFGLTGMGMCVLRLPGAVIEAEGSKLGEEVMHATNDQSPTVRQAAQSLLLAIQCVLQDPARTLGLVPDLTRGQKDLAVYYMARNGLLKGIGGAEKGEGDDDGERGERGERVLNEMAGLMARNVR